MASVGLNYVSVVVYYDVVPPRFFVSCYLSEISAQIKQMEARLDEENASLRSAAEHCKDSTKRFRFVAPVPEGHDEEDDQTDGPIRIQIFDEQPSINSNAPPVHLWVHVPRGDQVQKEHFVVDDFWDFIQVKFDDLDIDSGDPQLEHVDAMDTTRCKVHHSGRYPPQVQEMLKPQRGKMPTDPEKIFDKMKECDDKIVLQVKNLWHVKKFAYQHMRICEQLLQNMGPDSQ